MAANEENRSDQNPVTGNNPAAQIKRLLDTWFDDDDLQALAAAAALCGKHPIDIDTVFTYIHERTGTRAQTTAALREVRKALGLPSIPGAPCRKTP